jgi:hypothetical protein
VDPNKRDQRVVTGSDPIPKEPLLNPVEVGHRIAAAHVHLTTAVILAGHAIVTPARLTTETAVNAGGLGIPILHVANRRMSDVVVAVFLELRSNLADPIEQTREAMFGRSSGSRVQILPSLVHLKGTRMQVRGQVVVDHAAHGEEMKQGSRSRSTSQLKMSAPWETIHRRSMSSF